MRKLLIWLVTIICPGIIFLMTGRILHMLFAFFLQASLVGWIPAIIWARSAWKKDLLEEKAAEEKRKKATSSKKTSALPSQEAAQTSTKKTKVKKAETQA